MSEPRYSANARVQLTIEVDVGSSWGSDCTVAQVHKQGEEEAIGCVRQLLQEAITGDDRILKDRASRIRIVGHPKVTAVLAIRET
jgi:hypothetical protein